MKESKYAAKGAGHRYSALYNSWQNAAKAGKEIAEVLSREHSLQFFGLDHMNGSASYLLPDGRRVRYYREEIV